MCRGSPKEAEARGKAFPPKRDFEFYNIRDMKPKKQPRKIKEIHHFFLSELKNIDETTIALIIELMRASQHIKDIHKLMAMMSPDNLDEDEEFFHQAEMESLQTMILNISAAQLREAMKIIWKFSETKYFQRIKEKLSKEGGAEVSKLIELNNEFKNKKGFIFESLAPIRDLMFHYQTDRPQNKVVDWIRKRKDMELQKKPPYNSVNLKTFDFGLGFDYERSIYADFLFWGSEGFKDGMKWQKMVWEAQKSFLLATKAIIGAMFDDEKIEPRALDWAMQYFYGFRE